MADSAKSNQVAPVGGEPSPASKLNRLPPMGAGTDIDAQEQPPDTQEHAPDTQTEAPDTQAEAPSTQAEASGTQAEAPDTQAEAPSVSAAIVPKADAKHRFQSGVKKATAFAEMQRRHSIEEWQTVPETKFVPFIHPNHPLKMRWDLLLALMIMYSVISIPFRIAFEFDAEGFAMVVDIIIDIFFALDILVTFRTGYLDVDAEMQYNQKKIAKHYLTSWFAIDFFFHGTN
jgi:hypothetical protein